MHAYIILLLTGVENVPVESSNLFEMFFDQQIPAKEQEGRCILLFYAATK